VAPIGGCAIGREIMITFIEDESGATAIEYGLFFGFLTGGFYFSASSLSAYVAKTFSIL
tara:strand:- start:53 stop:229 length:177 start_codon:yes stop_codon:yes gene_type:complete